MESFTKSGCGSALWVALEPYVEHVVQVDIAPYWRNHRTLRSALIWLGILPTSLNNELSTTRSRSISNKILRTIEAGLYVKLEDPCCLPLTDHLVRRASRVMRTARLAGSRTKSRGKGARTTPRVSRAVLPARFHPRSTIPTSLSWSLPTRYASCLSSHGLLGWGRLLFPPTALWSPHHPSAARSSPGF